MTRSELKDLLADYLSRYPSSYTKKLRLRRDFETVRNDIFAYTLKLVSRDVNFKTRIYLILNELESAPRCFNGACGRIMDDKNIRNMKAGYPLHCCRQCAKESSHRKARYEASCESRYGKGVTNASMAAVVKRKKEASTLAHYGVRNPMQSDIVKDNVAKTNTGIYGSACPLCNSGVHAKAVASCIGRWGVASFSKTDDYAEKTKASNRRKFGVDYPNQDPEIRRRAQKRYTYDGMGFDSAPELAFYVYSVDHGENIAYQPAVSFEFHARGKAFRYQPDFKLDGKYIEIKGNQFFEGGNPASGRMVNPYDRTQDDIYDAKYRCMIANGIVLLTSAGYAPYMEYMRKTYGSDWANKYRRRDDGP